MENEHDSTYSTGEGSDPGLNRTENIQGNGEPVVVAEQPACPVDSQPEPSPSGSDGWNQPSSPPQDTWHSTGSASFQSSSWGTAGGQGQGSSQPQGGAQGQGSGQPQGGAQGQGSSQPQGGAQGQGSSRPQGSVPGQGSGQPQGGAQGQGNGQPGSQAYGQNSGQPVYKTAPPSYSGQNQPGNQYQNPYENQSGNQYQNPYENQSGTQYQTQYQKPVEENNSMATASLVMGILSLVSCCCSWLGIVFGILGIIFAFISKGEDTMCSRAKTGVILSGVGVAFNIILIILIVGLQLLSFIPEILS